MKHWVDIETIKRANSDRGQHFFEPGTMRFFDSRVGQTGVYDSDKPDEIYFVTSEQNHQPGHPSPRLYTVRQSIEGKVSTIGEFQQYETSRRAYKAIDRILG